MAVQIIDRRSCFLYSGMQANQAHPRPHTLDPVLIRMYWTQLNKAIVESIATKDIEFWKTV